MPDDPKPASSHKESSYIVIHHGPTTGYLATRMKALNEEGAGVAVINHPAHSGHGFSHVYPDKGEKHIEYDGQKLNVQDYPDDDD